MAYPTSTHSLHPWQPEFGKPYQKPRKLIPPPSIADSLFKVPKQAQMGLSMQEPPSK